MANLVTLLKSSGVSRAGGGFGMTRFGPKCPLKRHLGLFAIRYFDVVDRKWFEM